MNLFKKILPEEHWVDVIKKVFDNENYIEAICKAHAIDIISRTIASTELQVHRYNSKNKRIEEKKDEVYYRLNVKPNPNENGTNLKNKLVKKLLTQGKALIIFTKKRNLSVDYMYLADTYDSNNEILKGKTFTNVNIKDEEGNSKELKDDFSVDKGQCIYFVYENKYLNTSLVKYSNVAKKILKISENAYKSANVNKWRLKNQGAQPTLRDAETGKEISYKDYIEKITEGLLDEDESILLLSEVFDLFLLNKDKNKDLTDRTAIVKEIGDKQAMAYNIPLDVFYGTKTEKSNGNNDLITFGCEPCMKTIEDTINGGLIEEKDYLKGERVTFNRFCMQHLDITTLGTSLDKLTAIGFSFNQICRMLNLPEVDEDWANEHHVTKNYADVKGGVIDG